MNWFNDTSPKVVTPKVEPQQGVDPTPVKEQHKAKGARLKEKEHDVMLFLQTLSQDIKTKESHLPSSISERIDAFIKEHGNLHPETTKNPVPAPM